MYRRATISMRACQLAFDALNALTRSKQSQVVKSTRRMGNYSLRSLRCREAARNIAEMFTITS